MTMTRRNLYWALAGLVLGMAAAVIGIVLAAPGLMILEHRSPYDVKGTVQTIVSNATNQGWKVSKIYDFQKSLARPGEAQLAPIQVVELCQPDYARDLLRAGKNRFVATMMPCAVAVYEKEDGHVYVASMNVGLMGRLFGGDIQATMDRVGRDDAKILDFAASR